MKTHNDRLIKDPLSIEKWDRSYFIKITNLFVDQLSSRIIPSFDNAESESFGKFSEKYHEYVKENGEPKTGMDHILLMQAVPSQQALLEDLNYVKSTIISVSLSGLYAIWEVNVRRWLISRLFFLVDGEKEKGKIETKGYQHLRSFMEKYLDSHVPDRLFKGIHELSLINNTIKHGDGKSCNDLLLLKPDIFYSGIKGRPTCGRAAEYLRVSENDLIHYGKIITEFWQAIPAVEPPRYEAI